MSLLAILERAENDFVERPVEQFPRGTVSSGQRLDILIFVRLSLKRVEEKIECVEKLSVLNRKLTFVSLSSDSVKFLTESVEYFHLFWDLFFSAIQSPSYGGEPANDERSGNPIQELWSKASSLWISHFSSNQWMEPFFQSATALPFADMCLTSLIHTLSLFLNELNEENEQRDEIEHMPSVPVRKVALQKCIAAGCSAAATIVKTTLRYRMGLIMSLRIFTPPLETMSFLVKLENSVWVLEKAEDTVPHFSTRSSTSPPRLTPAGKLLEIVQDGVRRFAFFYGEFIFDHVFSFSLLSHSPLNVYNQNIPEGNHPAIRPVFWSVWLWLCSVYHATTTLGEKQERNSVDPFRMTAGQYLMAAIIHQFSIRLHRWLLNIPSPLPRPIQTSEILLLVLFARQLRYILGAAVYGSMVSRILYKLLAASAIEALPVVPELTFSDEEDNPHEQKSFNVDSGRKRVLMENTSRFFTMIWATPGLFPEELDRIRELNIPPWDPNFPRASSVQFILSGDPIYITRDLCRRLRHAS